MELNVLQPSRTTIMIKPVGALCNLDCTYCYYLPTKEVFGGHEHRMRLDTLESVFAGLLPHFDENVMVVWQGGEPTLAGLDFFRKAIEFQQKHAKPGQSIANSLQTNCTLLTDEWCAFLREHKFLVGASVDGGSHHHDEYRLTNRGTGSYELVRAGIERLMAHNVEHNLLCVLNDKNVHHPMKVYHELLELGTPWLQFIPAIEWEKDPEHPGRNRLAPYSPKARDYGLFLCRVFDRWFEKDRDRVSIRIFDAVLNKLVLDIMPFCILDGSCHNQLTVEHDGAIFGCDHFIERRWQLAEIGDDQWQNPIRLDGSQDVGLTVHGTGLTKRDDHAGRDIHSPDDLDQHVSGQSNGTPATQPDPVTANTSNVNGAPDADWLARVDESRLGAFARRKQDLHPMCKACQYQSLCYGGCPKHREHGGDVPEPSILCEGYLQFYKHALPRLNWLAEFLKRGEQPPPPGARRAMPRPIQSRRR